MLAYLIANRDKIEDKETRNRMKNLPLILRWMEIWIKEGIVYEIKLNNILRIYAHILAIFGVVDEGFEIIETLAKQIHNSFPWKIKDNATALC